MINIYIPQNCQIFYIDFFVFSLAILLLTDIIINYLFHCSKKLFGFSKKYNIGFSNKYNIEFSPNTILLLFVISLLFKVIQYLYH